MRKATKSTNEGDADLVNALEWIAHAAIGAGVDAQTFLKAARRALAMAGKASVSPTNTPRKVSVSQIAAVTGLSRKEIPELLVEQSEFKSSRASPIWAVVRHWIEDSNYRNSNGLPRVLSIDSGVNTFKDLVKATVPDVPHMSLLKELVRQGYVERRARKLVALNAKIAIDMERRLASFQSLALKTRAFGSSVYRSELEKQAGSLNELVILDKIPEKVVGLFLKTFSERSTSLLSAVEKWRAANVNEEDSVEPSETLGLGVYLLRQSGDAIVDRRGARLSTKPTRRAKRA